MSRIKKREWYPFLALVTLIGLLSACGGSDGGSPAGESQTVRPHADVTPTFAYVAADGLLMTYSIDPSTGGLTALVGEPLTFPVTFPFGGIAQIAVDPSGQFLYLLHFTGIHAYTINRTTGALTEMTGSPFGPSGYSLAFDVSGTHLYVAGLTSVIAPVNTSISAFSIGRSGALTLLARYTVSGAPSILASAGNHLYVAGNYTNSITLFSIGPSGELTPSTSETPVATDNGPNSIAVDPTGSVLYTAKYGVPTGNQPTPGSVSAFTIDPFTGALTPVASNPLPIAVVGPLSTDHTGKFLFVPEAAAVAVYAINSANGTLAAVGASPAVNGGGLIATGPTNETVYVAGRGTPNVSEFTLGSTGTLTPLSGSPFPLGGDPVSIAIAWK